MDKEELRKQGKLKKAVIFDCDNTLWQGVVGEDEVVTNTEIQGYAMFISIHGVIVGICSRNNEADVIRVLANQPLNDEFISVKRINWNDKVDNIKQIAEELNIGLDSIVLVDDSPFEINNIRERLPEVMAIYPHELMLTVHEWFDLSGDFTKTKQYKEQLARKREESAFPNYEEYLASLNMVIEIKINDYDNIPRIAELTQKTNQFNLTTMRCNEDEIRRYMTYHIVISASVSDRFGDNGLTAVIMFGNGFIEQFLMSCRIIGRNIEYSLMDYLVSRAKEEGYDMITGIYKLTPKNSQVATFYDKFAHSVRDEGDCVCFDFVLERYEKQGKGYICVKE